MTFIPHAAHPRIPSARGGWRVKPFVPTGRAIPAPPESDWLTLCQPLTEYFEGCYLTAYPDPCSPMADALVNAGLWYGVLDGEPIPSDFEDLDPDPWTCGWGQTGSDVTEGTVWTQDYADHRLADTLADVGAFVDSVVTAPMTPNQKAAFVDFTYNEGEGAFEDSTMLALFNDGDTEGAANEFSKWDIAGGQVNSWLQKRRACDEEMFLTGAWTAPE